ncbi:hypothetical protein ACO0QE_004530 [Hanseniaspora vineae]
MRSGTNENNSLNSVLNSLDQSISAHAAAVASGSSTNGNDNAYGISTRNSVMTNSANMNDIDSLAYNTSMMNIVDPMQTNSGMTSVNGLNYMGNMHNVNKPTHKHQLSINSLSSVSSANSIGGANSNSLFSEPITPPLFNTTGVNNGKYAYGHGAMTPAMGQYYQSQQSQPNAYYSLQNGATNQSNYTTNASVGGFHPQLNNKHHQKAASLDMGRSLYQTTNPTFSSSSSSSSNNTTHNASINSNPGYFLADGTQVSSRQPSVSNTSSSSNGSFSNARSNNTHTHSRLRSLPLINEYELRSLQNQNSTGANASAHTKAQPISTQNAHSNANQLVNTNDLNQIPPEELDFLKLSTDQYGCRFLQKKLEIPAVSDQFRDLIFINTQDNFLELIIDPFGNYLIQKLCDYITTDQKTTLLKKIYKNLYQISINQYGTRSLQKIIDCICSTSNSSNVTTDQQENNEEVTTKLINFMMMGFNPIYGNISIKQIIDLTNDLNGNHVVQKCIFKFPPIYYDFIIDSIIDNDNIVKVSTHKHGCCVLQKLLSSCTIQQIFKISIKILEYSPNLINDQFGNYILQFLFEIDDLNFYVLNEFYNKLQKNLVQLSCLKFSSNVVEKFLKKLFKIINDNLNSNSETSFNSFESTHGTRSKSNSVTSSIGTNKSLAGTSRKNSRGQLIPQVEEDDVLQVAQQILLNILDLFVLNLNVLIRDNYGNYALQTLLDVKNYSQFLCLDELYNTDCSFYTQFSSKVQKLMLITKNMLPSIKTTSYAKKIKLKVKAYTELTGFVLDQPFVDQGSDVSSIYDSYSNLSTSSSMSSFPGVPKTYDKLRTQHVSHGLDAPSLSQVFNKSHTRHVSLPTNALSPANETQFDTLGNHKQSRGKNENNTILNMMMNADNETAPSMMSATPPVTSFAGPSLSHQRSTSAVSFNHQAQVPYTGFSQTPQPIVSQSSTHLDSLSRGSSLYQNAGKQDYASNIWSTASMQQSSSNYSAQMNGTYYGSTSSNFAPNSSTSSDVSFGNNY